MKNLIFLFSILFLLSLNSCIGDDIIDDRVDPFLRISNPIDSLEFNTSYQFETVFLNNVGKETNIDLEWSSSDPATIEVSNSGLITANQLGNAIITGMGEAPSGEMVKTDHLIVVGNSTVITVIEERTGDLETSSSYALEGSFNLKEINGVLTLSFDDNYEASSALPGLFVYLTNNPSTTSGAYEIGAVTVFDGAHSYELPSNIDIMDYDYVLYFCKPFNVKVGDGQFD